MQLDPSIYESLQKERVEVGDVIYIEANSGAVKVLIFFLAHLSTWMLMSFISAGGPVVRLCFLLLADNKVLPYIFFCLLACRGRDDAIHSQQSSI